MSRREQIKYTAQNMFRERGFSATSMRDLAKEVGIEPASLYSHISSKEELLSEICFQIADEFNEALLAVESQNLQSDDMLHEAILAHVKVIIGNLDAAAVFLHEWRFLKRENLLRFKSLRDNYEERFRRIIEEGQSEFIFKEVNGHFTTRTIFSSLNWIYDWYQPNGEMTPEDIAEELSSLILNGIKII